MAVLNALKRRRPEARPVSPNFASLRFTEHTPGCRSHRDSRTVWEPSSDEDDRPAKRYRPSAPRNQVIGSQKLQAEANPQLSIECRGRHGGHVSPRAQFVSGGIQQSNAKHNIPRCSLKKPLAFVNTPTWSTSSAVTSFPSTKSSSCEASSTTIPVRGKANGIRRDCTLGCAYDDDCTRAITTKSYSRHNLDEVLTPTPCPASPDRTSYDAEMSTKILQGNIDPVKQKKSRFGSATSPNPPVTTTQTTFEVNIPTRPSPSPRPQNSEHNAVTKSEVAKQSRNVFGLLTPPPQSYASSLRPAPCETDQKTERQKLLEALKESTDPVKQRWRDVARHIGPIGFSATYSSSNLEQRLQRLAIQPKRPVNRNLIKLDWGDDQSPTTATRPKIRHPAQQVKEVLTARFRDLTGPPLTFDNNVNHRQLNGKFQFVDKYHFSPLVKPAAAATTYGCKCEGFCDPDLCSCLATAVDDAVASEEVQVRTYTQRDDGLIVLDDSYIANELIPEAHHFEIVECNEHCGCGPDCWNRVVGRGRTLPLEVFETKSCGLGVRSSVDIVRGQFIDVYLGEVITQQEVDQRESARKAGATSYIFALDWFGSQNCLHVDGEYFGTAMSFVNHSCNSNARSFTVITNRANENIHYLAFFAIRDIPAGTEITIDYSPQDDGELVEMSDELAGSKHTRCHCEAPNCRKWLWKDSRKDVQEAEDDQA